MTSSDSRICSSSTGRDRDHIMNPPDSRLVRNGFNRRAVSAQRSYPAKLTMVPRIGNSSTYTAIVNWCMPAEKDNSGSSTSDAGLGRDGLGTTIIQPAIRAVRDFPPFCGSNFPRLSREEMMMVMSGDDPEEEETCNEGVGFGTEEDLEDVINDYIESGIILAQPVGSVVKRDLAMGTVTKKERAVDGINVAEGESARGRKTITPMPENRFHNVVGKGNRKDVGGGEKTMDHNCSGLKRKSSSCNKLQLHLDCPMGTEDFGISKNSNAIISDPPRPISTGPRAGGVPRLLSDREKVMETLRQFREIFKKVSQEGVYRRVDLEASVRLKKMNKWINKPVKIVGPIPGVEVGDRFHYRIELALIGVHNPPQAGIDYLTQGGQVIATSIVASGGYANYIKGSNVLIYVGQGGNIAYGKKPVEDQKLERGNLALKNSISTKNLVRVTRREPKLSNSLHPRTGSTEMYIYDGLYLVTKYWSEPGIHGKRVFKFQLEKVAT